MTRPPHPPTGPAHPGADPAGRRAAGGGRRVLLQRHGGAACAAAGVAADGAAAGRAAASGFSGGGPQRARGWGCRCRGSAGIVTHAQAACGGSVRCWWCCTRREHTCTPLTSQVHRLGPIRAAVAVLRGSEEVALVAGGVWGARTFLSHPGNTCCTQRCVSTSCGLPLCAVS